MGLAFGPWFTGESKKPPQRRIQRLKQYIIDHFWFNLDLDTWGLTTKGRELARFSGMIDESVLAEATHFSVTKVTNITSI